MTDSLNLPLGRGSADAALATSLGELAYVKDKVYRLVRAGANITALAASGLVVNTAVASGAPTWVVTLATANAATVAGVIVAGTRGSTGTLVIQSGDYFWIQVSGPVVATAGAAIAAGALVAAVGTAGKVDDAAATAGIGAIGPAPAAAAADNDPVVVILKGLI